MWHNLLYKDAKHKIHRRILRSCQCIGKVSLFSADKVFGTDQPNESHGHLFYYWLLQWRSSHSHTWKDFCPATALSEASKNFGTASQIFGFGTGSPNSIVLNIYRMHPLLRMEDLQTRKCQLSSQYRLKQIAPLCVTRASMFFVQDLASLLPVRGTMQNVTALYLWISHSIDLHTSCG